MLFSLPRFLLYTERENGRPTFIKDFFSSVIKIRSESIIDQLFLMKRWKWGSKLTRKALVTCIGTPINSIYSGIGRLDYHGVTFRSQVVWPKYKHVSYSNLKATWFINQKANTAYLHNLKQQTSIKSLKVEIIWNIIPCFTFPPLTTWTRPFPCVIDMRLRPLHCWHSREITWFFITLLVVNTYWLHLFCTSEASIKASRITIVKRQIYIIIFTWVKLSKLIRIR